MQIGINGLFQCYNINYCEPLIDAIANHDIETIKSIARKINIPYRDLIYNNIDCDIQITRAMNFRILEDYKYVLEKCNQIYPNFIYDGYNLKTNLNLVKRLYDFDGLQYTCSIHKVEPRIIYDNLQQNEALELAINLGDIQAVENFLANIIDFYKKNLPEGKGNKHISTLNKNPILDDIANYYDKVLHIAYHSELLEIAELIIATHLKLSSFPKFYIEKNGHKHNICHFTYTNFTKNLADYLTHINKIGELFPLTEDTKSDFITLTHTIHKREQISFKERFITSEHNIYTKNFTTVPVVLEQFYKDITQVQNSCVRDMISIIEITHLYKFSIHIIIPEDGKRSFFSPAILLEPYKTRDNVIYIPFSSLTSPATLTHELTHFFFHILFNKGANSCFHDTSCYEYNEVVNNIISKIINKAIGDNTENDNEEIQNAILLNAWYRQFSTKDIEFTNALCRRLKKCDDADSKEEKEKILLELYLSRGYSEDFSFVLDRIHTYLREGKEKKLAELFPRLLEFYVLGIDQSILDIFEPAFKYWIKYITPAVNNYIEQHFIDCKEHFRSNIHNQCGVEYLNYDQQVEILRETVLSNNYNAVYYLYTQKEFIKNISNENKKEILKEYVRDCVKLCNSENECEYFWGNFFYWIKGIFSCKTIIYGEHTQYNSEYEQMAALIYRDLKDSIIEQNYIEL